MSIVVRPEISAERIKICKECKFHKVHPVAGITCGTLLNGERVHYYRRAVKLCGCAMQLKTKFHFATCPAGKWGAVGMEPEKRKKAIKFLESIKSLSKLDNQQVQQLYDWRAKISGETKQTKFCGECVREVIRELAEALSHEITE